MFRLLAILCVLFLAVACQKKDDIKPEVITPAAPKILATFSTNNLTLKNGEMGVCTLTYNVEGVCYRFTVDDNDKRISDKCADIIRIDTITVSQHIRLTCYHFDGKDTVLIKREGMINVTYFKITPVITITYDTVAKTVSWGTLNAVSLTLNGTTVALSGNKTFATDSLLHFVACSSDGTTTSQDVQVRMPVPMSEYQIITQAQGFHPIKEYCAFPNGHIDTLTNFPESKWSYFFRTNGVCDMYEISSGNHIGNPNWGFLANGTKLQLGTKSVYDMGNCVPQEFFMSIQVDCTSCSNGDTFIATYEFVRN